MELDHIFIFTDSPAQVANSLDKFGLTEGTPNIHPGQGTSCRRFFFENAYLELAWVTSEEEIKNSAIAKTRLWERSRSKLTGYCPFGLCFRNKEQAGQDKTLIFEDGWKYKPPYIPEALFVNVASNTDFRWEPMLFEMPFFSFAPKDYPLASQQPLNHKKAFKKITKVILTLPDNIQNLSTAMQKVVTNSIVAVSAGRSFSIALEFDDCIKGERQDFNHLVPLSIKW